MKEMLAELDSLLIAMEPLLTTSYQRQFMLWGAWNIAVRVVQILTVEMVQG